MLILVFVLVLVWYVCECMVLITNIKDDVRKPTCDHENCNPSQILIFGGHVKVRESLCIMVII